MDRNALNNDIDSILIEEQTDGTLLTTLAEDIVTPTDIDVHTKTIHNNKTLKLDSPEIDAQTDLDYEIKKLPPQISKDLTHRFNDIIFSKKAATPEFTLDDKDINKFTSQSLIDSIAELSIDPPDFNLESSVSLENKVFSRLERLNKYTELQSNSLHTVSKSLVFKLIKLVNFHIGEKNKLILEIEQLTNQQHLLEEKIIAEQEQKQELENSTSGLQGKLHEFALNETKLQLRIKSFEQKIIDLEGVIKNEKNLRAQLEAANLKIIAALGKEKEQTATLTEEKNLACEQARKAITRARQVMNHFFSSTLNETAPVDLDNLKVIDELSTSNASTL